MSDLHTTVVAELDRLERLYGGDRKDGRHAALKAAVGWHESYKYTGADWRCGELRCMSCEQPAPCAPLIDISLHLGVVRDGE